MMEEEEADNYRLFRRVKKCSVLESLGAVGRLDLLARVGAKGPVSELKPNGSLDTAQRVVP